MSVLGFGPTELRILVAIGALRAAAQPSVSLGPLGVLQLFDVGAMIAAASLAVVFAVSATRNTKALYAAEPPPGRLRDETVLRTKTIAVA
jgi:hypothetical protein